MRINYAMHNDSKLKGRTKEDYPYLQEMSDRYKGHSLCDEGKEKISNFVSGSTTVTNGKCNLRCKSDNVEYYENLGLGYHRGSTSGFICKCLPNFTTITNGYVNHRVPNDELEVWKSFGWVEGTKKSKVALIKLGLL